MLRSALANASSSSPMEYALRSRIAPAKARASAILRTRSRAN